MKQVIWALKTRIAAPLALCLGLSFSSLPPARVSAEGLSGGAVAGPIWDTVRDCSLDIIGLVTGVDVNIHRRYLECLQNAEDDYFSCTEDRGDEYQLCVTIARAISFPFPADLRGCLTALDGGLAQCNRSRQGRIFDCAIQTAKDGVDLLCPGPVGPCFLSDWLTECAGIQQDDIIIADS